MSLRFEPEHDLIQLLGVKKGAKVVVRSGGRAVLGIVEEITPKYLIMQTNPGGNRILINRKYVSWIEIIEKPKEEEAQDS